MSKVRVVLADSHAVLVEGIAATLRIRDDIEVAGIANTGEAAIQLVESSNANVLVIGIDFPGMNGIEATRHIHLRHPAVAILILTAHDYESYVLDALDAGATGYLLKTGGTEPLVKAVLCAHAGLSIFDTYIFRKILGNRLHKDYESGNAECGLNNREIEILKLVALGMTNRVISQKLFISPKTVQSHLATIFRKLDVRTRTEAVTVSATKGLLNIDRLPTK